MMTMSRFLLLALLSRVAAEVSTPSSLLGPRHFNYHPYEQYLKEVKPTKQGPIVFPNDAPPPPRPPLIVTSRPLTESIARTELNNSVAEQSRVHYQYDYEQEQPTLPPIYRAISDHANKNLRQLQKIPTHNSNYKIKEPDYPRQYESNNVNDDDNNDYNQAQNYAFSYIVRDQKTGDDFSHSQHSSGSATNGEYRVRLPDGRMQIVSYTADENGYKADVRYDDEKPSGISDYRNYNNREHKQNYASNQRHYANKNDFDTSNQINYENQNNYDRNNIDNYINNVDYNARYDYKDSVKRVNDVDNNYNVDTKPVTEDHSSKEDYQYNDQQSKDYYGNDYSLEYEDKYNNFDPHKSKFTAFSGPKNPKFVPKKTYSTASTVVPSYEELRPLFIQKKPFKSPSNNEYLYSKIPIEISVPSTTPSPYFDATTERVVIIGTSKPNLYTNIRSSIGPSFIPVTPVPKYVSPVVTTPKSFLASTIASIVNLKKNIDFSGAKPVLTNTFIDKINKYLSYTV
ncbi:GATA zinc finger domain-containing protein 4-like isoform X2 [Cydia pomonella]|uniref:GATA zinc finger domain-containing protein 4-like isoform X2 n=1 Tax=Cydia pomonella TaxID=82600 RepID=UPI002ADD8945|nr:GATA zinc finger domain-containing protein 4-like isoform X2 [Cydia pomonella]